MKRNLMAAITMLVAAALLSGCQPEPDPSKQLDPGINQEQVYQVSTLSALQQGVYTGETTFAELQDKGNLGIGTFDALNGEMIMIDGIFYQVRSDGKVYDVKPDMTCPFADITYYYAEDVKTVKTVDSLANLQKIIDPLLKNPNHFYAIRVDGKFDYIKARSVPAQTEPYPPLSEAVLQQTVFEYNNVEGTILGFWCPEYVDGINMPGYHFHFISKDRQQGGHLLDARVREALIGVDYTYDFTMHLPKGDAFKNSDLSTDQSQAVEKAER